MFRARFKLSFDNQFCSITPCLQRTCFRWQFTQVYGWGFCFDLNWNRWKEIIALKPFVDQLGGQNLCTTMHTLID